MPEHYSQFGEAAGAAMAHNARTAARHNAERAAEEQTAEAPRDGLSAPLSAPHSPDDTQGPDGRDNASDGRTANPDRAELCRQFKAAITRRWDVAPFVIDEIVDDAVDCHLELVGRATAILRQQLVDAEERARKAGRAANLLADSHRRAEQAEAALARVRALHQPHPEGGIGHLPDGGYGDISPACAACGTHDEYAVPWPCPTIRALDAPQAGDDTTGATP